MKVLAAPTSYKGTVTAAAAAAALARGARRAGAEVQTLPLSDGGPGLLDALAFRAGSLDPVAVRDPLGRTVTARVLRLPARAVAESADACGLARLAPDERDPERTDSAGVGDLLLGAATSASIVVGLGGSATVDGGSGMARALGWRFEDRDGREIGPGGGSLTRLERIVGPTRSVPLPPVLGLADVRTPLAGPAGAAAVFAPQKGADAAGVARLARGLERLAERIRADIGTDVADLPGGGAAGGLGAGLVAFAGGRLVSGSEWVLDEVGFDAALAEADVVFTGEGAYDAQTALGKVVGEVLRRAGERNVPVIVVAGRIDGELPPGVHGVSGGGAWLDEEGLAGLAMRETARLLGR